ncbi:hypothetical protein [Criblamydia sequanensis]|uniref:Uncharacterized protein n=1 Tax=Candidatus Criblamydia sequanensis CRIB-18 TaxID=1437425 RepID=A0A090D0U1_9BACT|nr:hypothetical protein [Criblamydia sequanensis]CDR33490.1 hypothetical protein CSEC_0657 [Criblamydia sequanensis CRIB-18]
MSVLIQDLVLNQLETQYYKWTKESSEQKEVEYFLDGHSVKVIFQRGSHISLDEGRRNNCIPNSINVPTENPEISKIFKQRFPMNNEKISTLKISTNCIFKVRYFNSYQEMKKILEEEKECNRPKVDTHWHPDPCYCVLF